MKHALSTLIVSLLTAGASAAHADVRITEWMYNGNAEFVEFTNLGAVTVDFAGWSYDDSGATPGGFDLSGFGLVAPGESVIITEADAFSFRADWALASDVKILGGYTNNLGRADQINLYDGAVLVDRLTYADNGAAGGPRTQGRSGVAGTAAALGADDARLWQLSAVGDFEHSFTSLGGEIGSPGFTHYAAAVPEPETWAMLLAGLGLVGFMTRRRTRA
jgi:predicted extracellular nuclease